MAFALVVVTVIGVVALVLVRTLRPDRQARGLTELCVLLAAYGAVYGPVGAGLVTLNEIDPDLSHLPSFVAGALMGASLSILVVGGIGLATALALWVLRRPVELPSKRLGAVWFLLLVVAFAVLFAVAMPVFGTMEDRSAVFAWVFTFLFYTVFWVGEFACGAMADLPPVPALGRVARGGSFSVVGGRGHGQPRQATDSGAGS